MNEENQNSATFGYAYIETGVVGCFSRDDLIVEMKFGETGRVRANVVHDGMMQTVFIERSEAEHFLLQILEAARKPEVLSGTRCTTCYYAKVRWKNLTFAEGGAAGDIDVKSDEFPTKEIEEFLSDFKDTVKAQEIKKLLAQGLHRRAIEIHGETKSFTKEKFEPEKKRA